MGRCRRAWGTALGLVLLSLIHPPLSRAGEDCAQWAARLVSLQGRVEQRDSDGVGWALSRPDARLCPGDSLRTGEHSRASILLQNETIVRIDQRTTIVFPESEAQDQNLLLRILRGIGYFFSRTPKSLGFNAPFVNAAIEGTEFLVYAAPSESRILVLDGVVRAGNAEGTLRVASGEGAAAGPGEAPRRILAIDPQNAVKWALYYPPVIDFGTRTSDVPTGFRDASIAFDRGDVNGALSALDRVPDRSRTTGFYDFQASILLYVGRVEEARASLARALQLDPEDGGALALLSIIALVLNDADAAMEFAKRGAQARGRRGAAWP